MTEDFGGSITNVKNVVASVAESLKNVIISTEKTKLEHAVKLDKLQNDVI